MRWQCCQIMHHTNPRCLLEWNIHAIYRDIKKGRAAAAALMVIIFFRFQHEKPLFGTLAFGRNDSERMQEVI